MGKKLAWNPPRTVVAVAVSRVGMRKAYKAAVFVGLWAYVTREHGRPPVTVDEFAEWMELSRAQAFRDQQVFRQAFPEFPTPTELWAALEVPPSLDQSPEMLCASVMSAQLAL